MKSSEYWQRRFDELEAAQLRKAERYNAREVDRQFKMALAKIEKELSYWYQRLGENNSISANEARKLLAADELKEFHWNVEEYILRGKQSNYSDKWKKMLENASAKMHISRLDAMKLQIQQQIEVLYGNQVDGLDELMHNMYTEGFNKSAYTLDTGMGVHYNLATTDPRRIDAIINRPWADDGKTFSDRLWRDKDKLVNALQQEMTQAVTRGDKLGDVVKNISKRMGAAKSSAARLVMTESAFISGRAQRDCFKDLGVDKYEYVATLDRKTSETCRDLDGKVFDIDDYKPGTNAPPMHCWCRSCIAPYFDDMEKLGKRAARDPETGKTILVPESMTYREWEKKYAQSDIQNNSSAKPSQETTGNDIIKTNNSETDYATRIAEHRAQISHLEQQQFKEWTVDRDNAINDLHSNVNELKIEAAKKGEILTSGLDKSLPKEDIDAIVAQVKAAPENIRIVWNRFEENIKILDKAYTGTPHYSPVKLGIKFNLSNDKNIHIPPYRSIFHEIGHLIDHNAGKTRFMPSAFTNGGEFRLSLKREGNIYLENLKNKLKAEAVQNGKKAKDVKMSDVYSSLSQELHKLSEIKVREVSDMWDGITRKRANGGWGHKASYWVDSNHLPIEAFAEMFCATMCNPESLAQIKFYFPDSYKIFEDMINAIAVKGCL